MVYCDDHSDARSFWHDFRGAPLMRRAFSLFELALALLIIGVVTGVTLASYRSGARNIRLQLEAQRVALEIRRAQTLATATKEQKGKRPCGYGTVFDESTPRAFILFAELDEIPDECDGPFAFSGGDTGETVLLANDVEIVDVSPGASLSVFFIPPVPVIEMSGGVPSASITLALISSPAIQKKIVVRTSGEITIETP